MTYKEAYEKLEQYNQVQLLAYYQELSEDEQKQLCEQINQLDFSIISLALQQKEEQKGCITPLKAMELATILEQKEKFQAIGVQTIQEGKVAALMLAGGMGTRLGFDQPKGMFNVGIEHECYIYQCQICNLLEVVKETGTWIPLYIMTSESNEKATISFLKEKNFFGYKEEEICFFVQEMVPATDFQGGVLLEEKGRVATSPNGNGGWFATMANCNLLEGLYAKGIEWINVFSVDNVLQRIADPCFIGATIYAGCTVGSKVVRKATKDEKVGVMCLEDGRPSIVEYYELTEDMMEELDDEGNLAYNFGAILNYLFAVEELKQMLEKQMPLHVVKKKIPCLNEMGIQIQPEKENGCKYETLALDMIHLSKSCLPYEVDRIHEFAPIKNKEGIDSVVTARALLQKNGVSL